MFLCSLSCPHGSVEHVRVHAVHAGAGVLCCGVLLLLCCVAFALRCVCVALCVFVFALFRVPVRLVLRCCVVLHSVVLCCTAFCRDLTS